MRRFYVVAVAILLQTTALSANPATEALKTSKEMIAAGRYADAVQALRTALPSTRALPAAEQSQALAAMHFYMALALELSGDRKAAQSELRQFFNIAPGHATLDDRAYPPPFIALFNSTRDSASRDRADLSFARIYPGYDEKGDEAVADVTLALWGTTPDLQILGTPIEKRQWEQTRTNEERSAFVAEFWLRRDSDGATPENETRRRFYKRVAFAERHFGTQSLSGALTDRGRVFILLGPPHYASLKNATRRDGAFIPQASGKESDGTVERWKYSREQLPAGMPRREVDFVFITQHGYGNAILQRDVFPLKVLGEALRDLQPH